MKIWQLIIACLAIVALGIGLVLYLTPKEQLKKDFNFYEHSSQPEVKDNHGPSEEEVRQMWCEEHPKLCKG